MTDIEKQNLVELLHQVVLSAVPNASTESKYGGTLYTLHPDETEGQFCGIFAYKSHVQLSFAHGAELDDPVGLLQGNGKYRRHLNFTDAGEVDLESLQRFIKSSAQF